MILHEILLVTTYIHKVNINPNKKFIFIRIQCKRSEVFFIIEN